MLSAQRSRYARYFIRLSPSFMRYRCLRADAAPIRL